ncbi:NADPH-dependent F420 reductase [Nocardioides coralli]|uniref:NADPH-dependent F420 reductase n=1 Tax=Nocardioides coralli TaxID=2872154 RepID=UPI001CA3C24F|nr:NAD(P)-binding domain-containing protein [Nocardioides coralli]QZY27597.1 NAD(P)-binding domain-containing protein [Nocardioides coralli]
MHIGIIGSGNIGGTLSRLVTAAGHTATLANSRGPDSLRERVDGVERLEAGSVAEAAAADLVIEAVPFAAVRDLPADALDGRILVSASNYYPDRDGEIDLDGRTHARWVADRVPGARVVKAFNTIWSGHLAAQGDRSRAEADRRVIPLVGDDEEAKAVVAELVRDLGFAPLDLGGLDDGHLQQPGAAIYNNDLTLAEARELIADTGTPPATPGSRPTT